MKKTIIACGLALLTSACVCDNIRGNEYQPVEQRYAYAQPAQPQQATLTYRSYVQASYTQPVRQQVVYQQPVYQQQVVRQPRCVCQLCGC